MIAIRIYVKIAGGIFTTSLEPWIAATVFSKTGVPIVDK
jgi:hypothetical protein